MTIIPQEEKISQQSAGENPAQQSSSTKEKTQSQKKGSENNNPQNKQKRLATEKHPTIEAILNNLFRFETREQAMNRLNAIKEYFIISSKLPKDEDENIVKLWIRGYKIEPDEEKEGYLGNYAALKVVEAKGKKFSIRAEKQRIALKYHPQRKRPKRKHPDWGHPALRLVKRGKAFEKIEEAQKILKQLHEEYPDISIPAVNKLFIIIYGKTDENDTMPVKKYILEIKTAPEGGFIVEHKVNTYQKNKVPEKSSSGDNSSGEDNGKPKPPEKAGYFTSMVELRRNKKQQISDLRKAKKDGGPTNTDSSAETSSEEEQS